MNASLTQDQINAEAARFQEAIGDRFTVSPNGYGIRVECNRCHESATHERGYLFGRNHNCEPQVTTPASRALASIRRTHAANQAVLDGVRKQLSELASGEYTEEVGEQIKHLVMEREILVGRNWGLNLAIQELAAELELDR